MSHVTWLGLIFAVSCAHPDAGTGAEPAAPETLAAAAPNPILGQPGFARPSANPVTLPSPATVCEPEQSAILDLDWFEEGVTRVRIHAYQVDRAFIVAQANELHRNDQGGAVMPFYWDGPAYAGMRFRAVGQRSVFRTLGFRSGDVLVSVNGQALDNPNRSLLLYDALRADTYLDLGVIRPGRILTFTTFTYEIR